MQQKYKIGLHNFDEFRRLSNQLIARKYDISLDQATLRPGDELRFVQLSPTLSPGIEEHELDSWIALLKCLGVITDYDDRESLRQNVFARIVMHAPILEGESIRPSGGQITIRLRTDGEEWDPADEEFDPQAAIDAVDNVVAELLSEVLQLPAYIDKDFYADVEDDDGEWCDCDRCKAALIIADIVPHEKRPPSPDYN